MLGGRCGGVPLGAAMVVFALWWGWWGAVVCKAVPAFARQLGVAAVVAVGCCVGLSGGASRACAQRMLRRISKLGSAGVACLRASLLLQRCLAFGVSGLRVTNSEAVSTLVFPPGKGE